MRANARAIASSEAGRRTENNAQRGARARRAPRSAAARRAAPLLNWWLTSTPSQRHVARRRRALVGHRDRVEAVQRGGQQRHAGDDRGDRHVAVERARPRSARRRPGSSVRVASSRGSPATATVRAIGGASPTENSASSQPERRTISSATAESLPPPIGTSRRLCRLSTAGARPHGRHRPRGRRPAAKRGSRQRRQLVGVGELAEALGVERLEQRGRRGRRGAGLAADLRRAAAVL